MNDIEVGEYVRTANGYIRRITSNDLLSRKGCYLVDKLYYNGKIQEDTLGVVEDEDITKHSKNIIDVLEVGDIVAIKINDDWNKIVEIRDTENLSNELLIDRIVSVLTHEQYEANCYRRL